MGHSELFVANINCFHFNNQGQKVKGESSKEDKGQSQEGENAKGEEEQRTQNQNGEKKPDNEKEDKKIDQGKENSNGDDKESDTEKSSEQRETVKEGWWGQSRKDASVIKETATHKNTTTRRLDDGQKAWPQVNVTAFTKAPQELPILNQPTTKSVQNFLPGVKPPSTANSQLYTQTKDNYPPWSGAYVEQLRKEGRTGVSAERNEKGVTRSEGKNSSRKSEGNDEAEKELSQILTEESTRKVPYDEELKNKKDENGNQIYFDFIIFLKFV